MPLVLEAEIARHQIILYSNARNEEEVIPAGVPVTFKVIDDLDLIMAAGEQRKKEIEARNSGSVAPVPACERVEAKLRK